MDLFILFLLQCCLCYHQQILQFIIYMKKEGSQEKGAQLYYEIKWTKDGWDTGTVNGVSIPYIQNVSLISNIPEKEQILNDRFSLQFSTLSRSTESGTVYLEANPNDNLYILIVSESGGGQSYHQQRYIEIEQNLELLLDWVQSYCQNQHRQEQCNFEQCDCKEKIKAVVESLRKGDSGELSSSYNGGGSTFQIYEVNIRKKAEKIKKIKRRYRKDKTKRISKNRQRRTIRNKKGIN